MKKYFVIRGEYRNTYKLYSAKTEATAAKLAASGAERITLKEAKNLIREEKERRKYDKAFSGYASVSIEDAEDSDYWGSDESTEQLINQMKFDNNIIKKRFIKDGERYLEALGYLFKWNKDNEFYELVRGAI